MKENMPAVIKQQQREVKRIQQEMLESKEKLKYLIKNSSPKVSKKRKEYWINMLKDLYSINIKYLREK